jgi:hypothetical protein
MFGDLPFIMGLAFPYFHYSPSQRLEKASVSGVTSDVVAELRSPKLRPSPRRGGKAAVVSVPEATMHEEDGFKFREDQIRLARKVPAMEPETQSETVCGGTHNTFWQRVLASDATHHATAD